MFCITKGDIFYSKERLDFSVLVKPPYIYVFLFFQIKSVIISKIVGLFCLPNQSENIYMFKGIYTTVLNYNILDLRVAYKIFCQEK